MKHNDDISIKKALSEQGTIIYPIKGISMLPLLKEGKNLVRLSAITASSPPKIGDVVLFRRENGAWVLHRIVSEKKHGYEILGDNCIESEYVAKKHVYAKMDGYYTDGVYRSCTEEDYINYSKAIMAGRENREIINPVLDRWHTLLNLLGFAITNQKRPHISADTDWQKLFDLAQKHNISSTVFGLVDESECPSEVYIKWKRAYEQNVFKTIMFEREKAEICNELEKNGISYVVLKGNLISSLYPKREMREFADCDILIDEENAGKVAEIFKSRSYEGYLGAVHDAWHKKPCFNFEIHKRLFEGKNDTDNYFQTISERLTLASGVERTMNDDDFYVYVIAHSYKHYSTSGAGLRMFSDLWLLKRHYSENGRKLPKELLEKLGYAEFESNVLSLADKMFTNPNSLTYNDLCFVMTSGTYGTELNMIANGISQKGRLKYLLVRLFPPLSVMRWQSPILNKLPILLPFSWIKRWGCYLFDSKHRRRFRTLIKAIFSKKPKA